MKKSILKFSGIFFIMLLFTFCGPGKQEKVHHLLKSAREKLYFHDIEGAWEDLEKCEKIDSKNPEVHFLKANILMTKRQYDGAMELYNKAIELNENYMEAYVNRGRLWFYLGDRDKQCEDYLKAESLGARNLYEETKFCR
jgi:tetratricopeptide (TPR) repeat protein